MASSKSALQQQLLSLPAKIVRGGGQVGVWGCVFIAIAGGWVHLPVTLPLVFLTGIGGNLAASILERASKGESISDDELQSVLSSPDQLAAIQQLIESKELGGEVSLQIMAQAELLKANTEKLLSSLALSRDSDHQEHGFIFDAVNEMRADQKRISQEAEQARLDQTQALISFLRGNNQSQTQELIAGTDDLLSQRLAAIIFPPSAASVQEIALSAKLDVARGLLQRGKAEDAKKIITEVRQASYQQDASAELRFRIATQLGACAHALDDTDMAVAELTDALLYHPNDPMALTNAATAASMAGNAVEALELSRKVRAIESQSSIATSVYISVLHFLKQSPAIEQLLVEEPWVSGDAMCLATLGDISLQESDFNRAEDYFRASIAADANAPLPHLLLAQSILLSMRLALHDDPPIPSKQNDLLSTRREDADKALSEVVRLTEGWDNSATRLLALANRAGVRAGLGRFDEAEQDCDRVLAENENHDTALRNKGQILLKLGNPERAIYYLSKIQGDEERKNATLPLASAYLFLSRFVDVITLLEPIWEGDAHGRDMIVVADCLMRSYTSLHDVDKVARIETKLLETWSNDPDVLSVLAYQRVREGKPEQAVTLLEQGFQNASGNTSQWIAQQLAPLYYQLNDYAKAVETYRHFVDTDTESIYQRGFLMSLYNSGQFEESLAFARSVRNDGPPIPAVSDIEISLLESDNDLGGAKKLLGQLVEIEPEMMSYRVHLVRLEARMGNANAAREAAQKVKYDSIKQNTELLMRMAFIYNELGLAGGLEFAYRARRIGYNDVQVQAGYVQFIGGLTPIEEAVVFTEPSEVGINCSVQLRRNNDVVVFTLIDEEPIEIREVRDSDAYFTRLLGLRVGDHVALSDRPLGDIPYTVLGIESKYAYAFHENLKRFQTGQLYDPNIFVVRFPA